VLSMTYKEENTIIVSEVHAKWMMWNLSCAGSSELTSTLNERGVSAVASGLVLFDKISSCCWDPYRARDAEVRGNEGILFDGTSYEPNPWPPMRIK
jgi:hypothetical protein